MLAETASRTSVGEGAAEQRVPEPPGRALQAGHLGDQMARRVPGRREARRVVVADARLRGGSGHQPFGAIGERPGEQEPDVHRLAGCERDEGAHGCRVGGARLAGHGVAPVLEQAVGDQVIPERLEEVVPRAAQPGRRDGHVRMGRGERQVARAEVVGSIGVAGQEHAPEPVLVAHGGAVAAQPARREVAEPVVGETADGVDERAHERDRGGRVRAVAERPGEHRARDARVVRVERHERRERLEPDVQGHVRVLQLHGGDGVLAAERGAREARQAGGGVGVVAVRQVVGRRDGPLQHLGDGRARRRPGPGCRRTCWATGSPWPAGCPAPSRAGRRARPARRCRCRCRRAGTRRPDGGR